MRLPNTEKARQHLRVHLPEELAWWIIRCRGSVKDLRMVAYTILTYVSDLDTLLKEVVRYIVYSSRLVREGKCQVCGEANQGIVAHHINYRRPLDVYWLCRRCHSSIHSNGTSWLDSEEDLCPMCQRTPGTYSTRRFPLLDALWLVREELKPLQAHWTAVFMDGIISSLRGEKAPEPPPDPRIQILQDAYARGELCTSLTELDTPLDPDSVDHKRTDM